MYQLTKPTAYKISGLVHVKYLKLPTRLLYKVTSTTFPLSCRDNFTPQSTGVLTVLTINRCTNWLITKNKIIRTPLLIVLLKRKFANCFKAEIVTEDGFANGCTSRTITEDCILLTVSFPITFTNTNPFPTPTFHNGSLLLLLTPFINGSKIVIKCLSKSLLKVFFA
jgi:hypothetical protein